MYQLSTKIKNQIAPTPKAPLPKFENHKPVFSPFRLCIEAKKKRNQKQDSKENALKYVHHCSTWEAT